MGTCNGGTCVKCSATDCNAQQTICQSCNSNTDTECAQLSATNNMFNTICTTIGAQCYVGVSGADTVRRCAESTDTCPTGSTTCQLCTGTNCNNLPFPDTNTAATVPAQTTGQATTLGTTATPIATTTPAATATPLATTTPVATETPIATATPVATTTPAATATTLATEATATPGATATPVATATPLATEATATPAATAAPGTTISCIECNSKDNKTCLGSAASIPGTSCPGNVCYQAWVDNVYQRGCLSKAESTLSQLCTSNDEQCKTCTTNLCNVEVVNAAAMKHLTIGLMISAALLACSNLV